MTDASRGAAPPHHVIFEPRRGLNRTEAARYYGISPTKFDEMVQDGRAPKPIRIEAYQLLARDLDRAKLASITRTISFDEIVPTAKAILDGGVRGRVVVEI